MKKVTMGPRPMIYPMPALLIGSKVDEKPNFMTAAWCGVASGQPPVISVGIQPHRYTLKGIRQNGTFSVNVPSIDQMKETDYCGVVSGADADKVKECRFEIFYGKLGNAPLIMQCPVNLECKVLHLLDLGSHILVLGRVEESHVSDDCLTDGRPDTRKIKPFLFTTLPEAEYCSFGEVIGKAFGGKAPGRR